MKRAVTITIAGMMALGATTASANFTSQGNAHVHPINDNIFEVVVPGGGIADVYWCGASNYARRVLKAGWQANISIARGLGASEATGQKSAVQFTLNPAALNIKPITAVDPDEFRVGDTKTVTDADIDCENVRS